MNGTKAVYIVLTDTGTWLSRTIAWYTGEMLNHASLAFDSRLIETYSFGRKEPHNPFVGGFVREDLHGDWFLESRRGREVLCAVYRCEVPEEAYRAIHRYVGALMQSQRNYKYNLLGLLGVAANIRIERKRAFFCSQFVAAALAAGGIRMAEKPPCLTTPRDLACSDRVVPIFYGPLSAYFKRFRFPKRDQFCYNHNESVREKSG